ncbi:MAG: hypothetical protein K9I94_03515 [Bacteroidales bacterium]|nr:hypothetical protein [Bacteroidales bacterium]
MEIVTIQLTTPKTMKLLRELEELNLLKVIKPEKNAIAELSDKYAGKLALDIANDLQDHIAKSREEWENNI